MKAVMMSPAGAFFLAVAGAGVFFLNATGAGAGAGASFLNDAGALAFYFAAGHHGLTQIPNQLHLRVVLLSFCHMS